jgi:hypothetical protein
VRIALLNWLIRQTFKIAIIALSSCTTPVAFPDQAQAIQIVWYTTYFQTVNPPTIDWYTDCAGPHDEPGVALNGTCVGGVFEGWNIALPWVGTYHESQLAHELLHAKQALEGVYDTDHVTPEWQTLLPLANINLINAEL